MTAADLLRVLPEELARGTLALPNTEAWRAMGVRLAGAGVRCAGQAREAAWVIRRELQAAQGLTKQREPPPSDQAAAS